MRSNPDEKESRALITIGVLVLAVVIASSTWSVLQYRGLADCNQRAIRTLHARDQYSDQLRALADRDQANIDRLVTAVTESTDRSQIRQALTDYVAEAHTVDELRTKIRRAQDRSVYPSLADCD